MEVSALAFKKLYELITEEIFNNELTHDQQKSCFRPDNYLIWDIKKAGAKGQNYFDRIFAVTGVARNHFWKKAKALEKSKAPFVPFKDHVFIAMLEYIDVKVPDDNTATFIGHPDKKADFLYKKFKEKYGLDTNENPVQKNKDVLLVPETEKPNDYTEDIWQGILLDRDIIIKPIDQKGAESKIIQCVSEFYYLIAQLGTATYQMAMEYMVPPVRIEYAKNDLLSLMMGYIWTFKISKLNVWGVDIDNNLATCNVYFEDHIDLFDAFRDLKIKEMSNENILLLGEWVEQMQTVRELSGKNLINGRSMDEIDSLWYIAGIDTGRSYDANRINNRVTKVFIRTYTIYLEILKGEWYINIIRKMPRHK